MHAAIRPQRASPVIWARRESSDGELAFPSPVVKQNTRGSHFAHLGAVRADRKCKRKPHCTEPKPKRTIGWQHAAVSKVRIALSHRRDEEDSHSRLDHVCNGRLQDGQAPSFDKLE